MKQIAVLLVLLIAGTVFGEEPAITTAQQKAAMARATEFRTFTTVDGEEIVGRPIGFKNDIGVVELETSDGPKQTVELSSLSEKNQTFIQDWHPTHSLVSKRRLRITVSKKNAESTQWSSYQRKTQDEKKYEFIFENKSGGALNDIHVEYCIYIHTEVETRTTKGRMDPRDPDYKGSHGPWVSLGKTKEPPIKIYTNNFRGTFFIERLPKRNTVVKETMAVILPENQQIFDFSNSLRTETETDTELLGIRYRIFLPTPAGNYVMMEFAEPKSLLKEIKWPSKSIGVR